MLFVLKKQSPTTFQCPQTLLKEWRGPLPLLLLSLFSFLSLLTCIKYLFRYQCLFSFLVLVQTHMWKIAKKKETTFLLYVVCKMFLALKMKSQTKMQRKFIEFLVKIHDKYKHYNNQRHYNTLPHLEATTYIHMSTTITNNIFISAKHVQWSFLKKILVFCYMLFKCWQGLGKEGVLRICGFNEGKWQIFKMKNLQQRDLKLIFFISSSIQN